LAKQPHINFPDGNGRSPLAVAIALGNETATDILWRQNADHHLVDNTGNSMLHLACNGPSVNIARHMLEHGTGVNTRNAAGETPLHLACATKDGNIVREICKKGAIITIPDGNLRTPLMTAIMSNNRRAAAVLLEWEFVAGTDLLDKTDANGLKAIQYCGLFNDPETEARIKTVELALINALLTTPQPRTVYFNSDERHAAASNAAVDPLEIFPDQ